MVFSIFLLKFISQAARLLNYVSANVPQQKICENCVIWSTALSWKVRCNTPNHILLLLITTDSLDWPSVLMFFYRIAEYKNDFITLQSFCVTGRRFAYLNFTVILLQTSFDRSLCKYKTVEMHLIRNCNE